LGDCYESKRWEGKSAEGGVVELCKRCVVCCTASCVGVLGYRCAEVEESAYD
jgi:hypothetical protein